jgi:hypothetical protein
MKAFKVPVPNAFPSDAWNLDSIEVLKVWLRPRSRW